MRDITLIVAALIMAMCVFGSVQVNAATGQIVFCKDVNDQFQPQDPATEFAGPVVSWIATATKQYGKPTITLTIYKNEGKQQALVERRKIDVNPEWDTTCLRNMKLGDPGQYTVSLTTDDGEPIASGTVTITGGALTNAAPEETLGTRLEAIFNKYAPKKQ